jgi:hypothetical protein
VDKIDAVGIPLASTSIRARILLLVATLLWCIPVRCHAQSVPVSFTLGRSLLPLDGPWKFHTGDDAAWADPELDDSAWESVDLTAAPGAHDEDVGLTGYVAGWGARGHSGYYGYAWYRPRVAVTAPDTKSLRLSGPPAVDSAYQLFVNGQSLGECGRFTDAIPAVFSIQPRIFTVPPSLIHENGHASLLIAVRVWMGPWDLGHNSGGIRIAPVLGDADSIDLLYRKQWLQTVSGYIVEVVEAAAFISLALMAAVLIAFEHSRAAYVWMCTALVLTALYRANQAIFSWGQFETVHAYELISLVLLIPLCQAAWVLAWRGWFRLRGRWMSVTVGALTFVYVGAQFLAGSWFHGFFSHAAVAAIGLVITWTRIAFVLLVGSIPYQVVRQSGRKEWFSLIPLGLMSIGQFAQEISALGIQGIWFPYGTGVSRTQFAYAAFDLVFFVLLLQQYLSFAKRTGRKLSVTADVACDNQRTVAVANLSDHHL